MLHIFLKALNICEGQTKSSNQDLAGMGLQVKAELNLCTAYSPEYKPNRCTHGLAVGMQLTYLFPLSHAHAHTMHIQNYIQAKVYTIL